jgi:AcrR family transcriptional regulator
MSKPVKTRTYNSPKRAEQARQTRRRVVEVATHLFLARGYPRTTLAAIGSDAGVAADTVLHLFGSKRGLLSAVMDVTIGGDDEDVPLLQRADPQAVRAEPNPHRQIRMFAAGMTTQLERVRPMDDILRTAALVDESIAALRNDLQLRQRRQGMIAVATWIAAHTTFRGGRSVEEAGALIWTLTSSDVHRMLREDWGWSKEQFRDWLGDTLDRTLLED